MGNTSVAYYDEIAIKNLIKREKMKME